VRKSKDGQHKYDRKGEGGSGERRRGLGFPGGGQRKDVMLPWPKHLKGLERDKNKRGPMNASRNQVKKKGQAKAITVNEDRFPQPQLNGR